MPNIKSAKKRVLVNDKKAKQNASERSALRTSVKKAKTSIANKDPEMTAAVRAASSSLDKAVSKGIIKKNTANRRKSRLAKAANAVASE